MEVPAGAAQAALLLARNGCEFGQVTRPAFGSAGGVRVDDAAGDHLLFTERGPISDCWDGEGEHRRAQRPLTPSSTLADRFRGTRTPALAVA
jgi:hypothetical protein